MDSNIPVSPLDRVRNGARLSEIVDRAAQAFGLGSVRRWNLIETGYEDCNVEVETASGNHVLKVFAEARTADAIDRIVGILEKVEGSGVRHPKLSRAGDGGLLYTDTDTGEHVLAMKHVDGSTFRALNRVPSDDELADIIEQAAALHAVDYHPPLVYDLWAIPHISTTLRTVEEFLSPQQLHAVENIAQAIHDVQVGLLPHALVHGDITKDNAIVAADHKVWIVDFSVASWCPRIQELAVIAGSLLHDDQTTLGDRVERVVDAYDAHSQLTAHEVDSLHRYALGAVAMEFLGATHELNLNGNDTDQNRYWLDLGRRGLESAGSEYPFVNSSL